MLDCIKNIEYLKASKLNSINGACIGIYQFVIIVQFGNKINVISLPGVEQNDDFHRYFHKDRIPQ